MNNLKKLILLPFFIFLAWQLHAALTLALLQQHAGAMLFSYISNNMRAGVPLESLTIADLVASAPNYRVNGSVGTLADRTEAMQTIYRQLAARAGLSPTGTPGQIHFYKNHWLAVYTSTTEAVNVEP